jgi:hypothetical protein
MRESVTHVAAIAAEIARIRALAPNALGRRWRAVTGALRPSAGGREGQKFRRTLARGEAPDSEQRPTDVSTSFHGAAGRQSALFVRPCPPRMSVALAIIVACSIGLAMAAGTVRAAALAVKRPSRPARCWRRFSAKLELEMCLACRYCHRPGALAPAAVRRGHQLLDSIH